MALLVSSMVPLLQNTLVCALTVSQESTAQVLMISLSLMLDTQPQPHADPISSCVHYNNYYYYSYVHLPPVCSLECEKGYEAAHNCSACEPVHICTTNDPCLNEGSCIISSSNSTDYLCACGGSFVGTNCEGLYIIIQH